MHLSLSLSPAKCESSLETKTPDSGSSSTTQTISVILLFIPFLLLRYSHWMLNWRIATRTGWAFSFTLSRLLPATSRAMVSSSYIRPRITRMTLNTHNTRREIHFSDDAEKSICTVPSKTPRMVVSVRWWVLPGFTNPNPPHQKIRVSCVLLFPSSPNLKVLVNHDDDDDDKDGIVSLKGRLGWVCSELTISRMVLRCAIHLEDESPYYVGGGVVSGVLVLSTTWSDKVYGEYETEYNLISFHLAKNCNS